MQNCLGCKHITIQNKNILPRGKKLYPLFTPGVEWRKSSVRLYQLLSRLPTPECIDIRVFCYLHGQGDEMCAAQ